MNKEQLTSALAHCTGTESYTRHSPMMPNFLLTDGAKCFAENAGGGCYWLMDILGSEPKIKKLVLEKGIAFVRLTVSDGSAVLTVEEDEGIPPVFNRKIDFTDCPEGKWMLYLQAAAIENPGQIVCMVPSEY